MWTATSQWHGTRFITSAQKFRSRLWAAPRSRCRNLQLSLGSHHGVRCCGAGTFSNHLIGHTQQSIFGRMGIGCCVSPSGLSGRASNVYKHTNAICVHKALFCALWGCSLIHIYTHSRTYAHSNAASLIIFIYILYNHIGAHALIKDSPCQRFFFHGALKAICALLQGFRILLYCHGTLHQGTKNFRKLRNNKTSLIYFSFHWVEPCHNSHHIKFNKHIQLTATELDTV